MPYLLFAFAYPTADLAVLCGVGQEGSCDHNSSFPEYWDLWYASSVNCMCMSIANKRCLRILLPLYFQASTMALTVCVTRDEVGGFLRSSIIVIALSISTNIIVTILLVIRILRTARNLKGILSDDLLKPYSSAIGIIVESSALNSVSSLVHITLLILDVPAEQITSSISLVIPVCVQSS